MKREKMLQNGEKMYYVQKGCVTKCEVLYSAYDPGIKERYYMTNGLSFVHSDIGNIVFRTVDEAKDKEEFSDSIICTHSGSK